VDLILQQGLNLMAIEIKSSKTFNKNFLKGLVKFQNLAKKHSIKSYVVYSGEHEQKVHDSEVLNFQNISKLLKKER
jgi:hypothetical protein